MTATAASLPATDSRLHGFRITRVTPVDELDVVAVEAEHEATGCRVLHLVADDDENLFAIALRTPPADDAGLPHILEHTVLCGSKKFPVKDPFVELLRTSLATFLNAMTYPDRTVYPCASMNRRDFYNLADVYCDAVFHPLIKEDHFRQEGHRLGFAEAGDQSSDLVTKGIVYNEMKGVYSDFSGTWFRAVKCGIAPDTVYGYDSGGKPEAIPELSYRDFTDFHQTYYHPSNASVFSYGNLPTDELLAFLAERLSGFERIEVPIDLGVQQPWTETKRETVPFPIGPGEDTADRAAISVTWLVDPVTDVDAWLAMQVLETYLLDNDASPLRRALIASGLGKGMAPSGYFDFLREGAFSVGLKGTEADRAAAIEAVIDDTLAACAEAMDAERLDAAFHQQELDLRTIGDQYPLGLMERAFRRWLYDCDPLQALDLGGRLAALRQRSADDPGFLPGIVRRCLVDNPHRLVQTFVPDAALTSARDQAERERMAAKRAALSDAELAAIAAEDTRLEAAQAAPNAPEALATLPRLGRDDVAATNPEPVVESAEVAGVSVARGRIADGGVGYWSLAFDCTDLADDLVEYLPLYAACQTRLGAGGDDFLSLADREARICGGIDTWVDTGPQPGAPDDGCRLRLRARSHALERNLTETGALLAQRLWQLDLDQPERLLEVVKERHAALRNGIVGNGSSYASGYAGRYLRPEQVVGDRLGGVAQLAFFDEVLASVTSDPAAVIAILQRIHAHVLATAVPQAAMVGPDAALAALEPVLSGVSARTLVGARSLALPVIDGVPADGLATAADVAFVARTRSAPRGTGGEAAAMLLLSQSLRTGYLWERIRVQGGAYGARFGYDRHAGTLTLASYRDPHIARTLRQYDGLAEHVANEMDLSADAIEQAIIGTIKAFDRPLRPAGIAGRILANSLAGSSAADRQALRDSLLALDADTIRATAASTLDVSQAPICALASRDKLEAAAEDGVPFAIRDL